MKSHLFLIIALLGVVPALFAQNITGTVMSATGQAIPSANIVVLNNDQGTFTDDSGAFQLTLAPGAYQIAAKALGYATKIVSVEAKETPNDLRFVLAESTKALDEVVISAERSETNLQKTPIAVSVINAQEIQDYRIWSFSDMSELAPSLQTVEHGGSTSSLFINIRGVMGLHSQSAVATYIDGVYQFESFSVPLQFNNVERIEVLRGPQGTLYGRNAFGGVINIITKKPTNQTTGFAQVDLGNYHQQRYSVSFSTPIVKDKLFAGVSGVFNQRKGIYTNTVTNTWFDRPQSITGGLNLRYLATDRWSFGFDGRFERNEDYGSYPWVTSDSLLFAAPYTVSRDLPNIERRNNINASVKADYQGNKVQFHSISAYLDYQRWFPKLLDTDFSAENLSATQNDNRINTFTQEFRLSSASRPASAFDWTIGTFLWTAPDGTNSRATYRTAPAGEITALRNSVFNNQGIAFFGQATYALTDQWSVTAGLRYDKENQKLAQARQTIQPDGSLTENIPFTDFENTFGAFTPKVVLSNQLNESTMAYAQYARGFRAGGLNAFAPTLADVPFQPEYSDNYEIGMKNTLFADRLRLNLTGFYLQQRDQQINVIEDGFFLTRNTGDMNNLGAEVELSALPVRGLQVMWNASVSDARYVRLTTFSGGENQDFSGNKPLFNPGFASFLAVQYTQFFGDVSAFVRGEHRYTGAYYMNFDNVLRQPPFHLFNTRMGLTYKKYELAFWVRNLTDVKYRTWATGIFLLSNPRMWGLTATARF